MRYIKSYTNDAAIQAAVNDKSLGKPYVALDENTGKIDWNGKEIYNYFCITNRTSTDGIINIVKSGSPHNLVLKTRTNGGSWSSATTYSNTFDIPIPANGYVEFDGVNNPYWSNDNSNCWSFNPDVEVDISGDLYSLVSARTVTHTNEFYRFFQGNGRAKIINASGLTLNSMTLTKFCYGEMFALCGNLESAPVLPATSLVSSCYINMFNGCGKLKYIKCLANNTGTAYSGAWVEGVSSTGTFVKAAGVNWPRGISGIPRNWTVIEE